MNRPGKLSDRVSLLLTNGIAAGRSGASLVILGFLLLLGACESQRRQVADAVSGGGADLSGSQWQVEDIDGGGIIDRSNVTIEIDTDGQLHGSAGCNRYFASLSLDGGKFAVTGMGNTSKACVVALDDQEFRFLAALREAATYTADDTFLRLFDGEGLERVRAVRRAGVQQAGSPPADIAEKNVPIVFACGGDLEITVTFVGPEVIRLTSNGEDHLLQRERAASGARFSGDGIVFWNKGDEALFDVGGIDHQCARK